MRFIAGLRATALAGSILGAASAGSILGAASAGSILFAASAAWAQSGVGVGALGGSFGGAAGIGAGYGVGAYGGGGGAPTSGPVGARGFFGGGNPPYQPVIGFLGGGWGGGGWGGYGGQIGDSYVAPGGNAAVYNYYYHDARRNDGGFYGGGGVFYADDGYSRMYADRPSYGDGYGGYYGPPRPAARTGYAPVIYYRPAQHVFYLQTTSDRVARKRGRYEPRY